MYWIGLDWRGWVGDVLCETESDLSVFIVDLEAFEAY